MIPPGTRLGHYEVLSAIGKGGMGEVWRARDTKLGREVAIKTLPSEFAQDPDRLARFEREARLLASLNHPHIAAIHGLEEHDGARFLVLELVEGDTLADRLKRGAIPVEDALKLALEIAEALEAAHEKGVVHRDLKPANIKVTAEGRVKVLDFGLAKAFGGDAPDASLSNSPTLSMAATQAGIILGTAAYMSPEQARGEDTDRRTDIWAFGCVLYEMLAGRQVFDGPTVSDTLASVLKNDPDWDALPRRTPAPIRRLLRRALDKDRKQRLAHIGDASLEIRDAWTLPEPEAAPGGGARASKRWRPWAAAILMFVAAAVAAWSPWRATAPVRLPIARLPVPLPDGQRLTGAGESFASPVTISPDGAAIVYAAVEDGRPQLYRRDLDQFEAQPIPGTEGATSPFFSPDGQWIGFFANGRLQRVPLQGGAPVTIAPVPGFRGTGVHWSADNQILFIASALGSGIFRVPAGGETPPEPLTAIDVERGEYAHSWPQLLPGGRHVLFSIWRGGDRAAILSLDTLEWREILPDASGARFVPSGHIVYRKGEDSVEAVAFDTERLEIVGDPVALVDDVDLIPRAGSFSAAMSAAGTLVYVPADPRRRTLVWVDRRTGDVIEAAPERGPYEFPRISPEGRRVAFSWLPFPWVLDLERGSRTRITTVDGFNNTAVWMPPDGTRITFANNRTGPWNLYSKPAEGSEAAELMFASQSSNFPYSWSPNGQLLAFSDYQLQTAGDIWVLPRGGEPEPFVAGPFEETQARFSRDGRFLAYASNESGRFEVYVEPYPPTGDRTTVSTSGGLEPVWSPGGRELFYRQGDIMMAVDVSTAARFEAGPPRPLFEGRYETDIFTNYDISPDGERFLMVRPDPDAPRELRVVLNWFEELRRLAPVE